MIVLDTTTRKLQLVLSAAKTANDCPFVANYVDYVAATPSYTPGSSNGTTNGLTSVDAVASPAASTQRQVKYLALNNADTRPIKVTVRYNDNGTTRDFGTFVLMALETLQYTDGKGFQIIDAAGQLKRNDGRSFGGSLIGMSLLTAGTSFATGMMTNTIKTYLQAGGGAGGGAGMASSGKPVVGGGGSAGGYAEKTFAVSPLTAYTYAIGSAGQGSAGASGGVGGNTTFAVGGTTVTATGGNGGTQSVTAGAPPQVALGGATPVVSTNGDFNAGGAPGGAGRMLSASIAISGDGGSSKFGPGAAGRSSEGTGNSATIGYGGGGGGAVDLTNDATTYAGGNGGGGGILVEEYS